MTKTAAQPTRNAAVPAPDPSQYDSIAADFEDYAATSPYNALYDRPATLDLVGDVSGKRVLDAGCGPGIYAAELLRKGADVMGCDASPRMIELAVDRAGDQADLRVHRLEKPFDWIEDQSIAFILFRLIKQRGA